MELSSVSLSHKHSLNSSMPCVASLYEAYHFNDLWTVIQRTKTENIIRQGSLIFKKCPPSPHSLTFAIFHLVMLISSKTFKMAWSHLLCALWSQRFKSVVAQEGQCYAIWWGASSSDGMVRQKHIAPAVAKAEEVADYRHAMARKYKNLPGRVKA